MKSWLNLSCSKSDEGLVVLVQYYMIMIQRKNSKLGKNVPSVQPPCILFLCVTKWKSCMLKILFGGEVVALRMQQALEMKVAIEAM
jgi:hypothetical protein